MDFDKQWMNNKDMWEWQEADYYLKENPRSEDISRCLWDEVNQSEDSLMYMLEEQTPIKDCADFDYRTANFGDNINKQLDECRDSSQQKRRRTLHFPNNVNEIVIGSLLSSSASDREDEQINKGSSPPVNVEWNLQYDIGLSDGSCAFNSEAWNPPSEGWLDNCLDENVMQYGTDETVAPVQDLNYDEVSDQPVNVSELCNLSADRETNMVLESKFSIRPKILKGCKNIIGTSTKLTSVAYPFALIKPCGVEGDLTLKDINQKLHTPPPSRSKDMQDENSSLSYPTSAFSGKPVVVKTKIRTEGGKGSITIMRTKG